jgi:hypothetical protein
MQLPNMVSSIAFLGARALKSRHMYKLNVKMLETSYTPYTYLFILCNFDLGISIQDPELVYITYL